MEIRQAYLTFLPHADGRAEAFRHCSLEVAATRIGKIHWVGGFDIDALGQFLLGHPGRDILRELLELERVWLLLKASFVPNVVPWHELALLLLIVIVLGRVLRLYLFPRRPLSLRVLRAEVRLSLDGLRRQAILDGPRGRIGDSLPHLRNFVLISIGSVLEHDVFDNLARAIIVTASKLQFFRVEIAALAT